MPEQSLTVQFFFLNCSDFITKSYYNVITVESRFSDWAHYNEFVESGAKSWVVMRRRLVLGMKGTQNRAAQSSHGEGTPRSRTGMRQLPLDHAGASLLFLGLPPLSAPPPPPLWMVSVVIYSSLPFIFLLHLSVIHAYPQVHVPSVKIGRASCRERV